jgi:hypothetical protein
MNEAAAVQLSDSLPIHASGPSILTILLVSLPELRRMFCSLEFCGKDGRLPEQPLKTLRKHG